MIKMRYKDIPKYTRSSQYCVNVHLSNFKYTIDEFKEEYGLQLNPEFQRGHKWTEKQQCGFIEFFLKGGKCESIKFNKPSWQNYSECNEYDDMVCVDGLQRTTAILRFTNNEIKVFGCYWNEFDKPAQRRLSILVDVNDLKTEVEVLQWYIDLNSGGTIHTDEEIEKVKTMMENLNNN